MASNSMSATKLRISTRRFHPPVWMKDYVTTVSESTYPYSLANHVSYALLSPRYQAYLSQISKNTEPKSYEKAVQDQRWVEAMQHEIAALEDNGTWSVVPLPPGEKVIRCRWVYKIK